MASSSKGAAASSRRSRGKQSFIDFANKLYKEGDDSLCRITPFRKFTAAKRKQFMGRIVLVEAKEFGDSFSPATHMVAKITGWDAKEKKLITQAYNQNGDKDGPRMGEHFEDLWVLPKLGEHVTINKKTKSVDAYDLSAMCVALSPVITTAIVATSPGRSLPPIKAKRLKKLTPHFGCSKIRRSKKLIFFICYYYVFNMGYNM